MSLNNFKTYQLAQEFHRAVLSVRIPSYLRDQLLRASSSVVLNVAEGSGKMTSPTVMNFMSMTAHSVQVAFSPVVRSK